MNDVTRLTAEIIGSTPNLRPLSPVEIDELLSQEPSLLAEQVGEESEGVPANVIITRYREEVENVALSHADLIAFKIQLTNCTDDKTFIQAGNKFITRQDIRTVEFLELEIPF